MARARPDAAELLAAAGESTGARARTEVVPGPVSDAEPAPERGQRRRRRTLLLAVPLVLAAGTPLAIQLLPDTSPGQAAEGGARPAATSSPRPGTPQPASPGSPTAGATRTPT